MEGVRRWMSSSQGTTNRKVSKAAMPPTLAKPEIEIEPVDPLSLAGIIARSLAPNVSEDEEAEYQW